METILINTNIFTGIGGILGNFIKRKQDEMKNVTSHNVHP